jgi:phosphoribosylanthranilate isomerase
MFRIKICGITTPDDAVVAARAGAEAIGVNFYRPSPRFAAAPREIVDALPVGICKVGVFVNSPPDDICELFDGLGLDLIQLHGDEPPEHLLQLGKRPVLKAFRCGQSLREVAEYLQRCEELGCRPAAVLIDAAVPGQYGGTGAAPDWELIARDRGLLGDLPLVLAGGLRADNVAQAIAAVRPNAVDVASGVEQSLGIKSPDLVARFVAAARQAFDRSQPGTT